MTGKTPPPSPPRTSTSTRTMTTTTNEEEETTEVTISHTNEMSFPLEKDRCRRRRRFWRKVSFLALPLVLVLCMLKDHSDAHHLAVMTALQRQAPSQRIFRALGEVCLLLFCTAISLGFWEGTIGTRTIGTLLFEPTTTRTATTMTSNTGNRGKTKEHHQEQYDDEEYDDELDDDDDDDMEENREPLLQRQQQQEEEDPSKSSLSLPSSLQCWKRKSTDKEQDSPASDHPLPPSSWQVANAAVDLSVLVLVFLVLFTISSAEGGRYIHVLEARRHTNRLLQLLARVAAPSFPLLLVLIGKVLLVLPWKNRRQEFWTVLSYTLTAPWSPVTFRDGFIGDILTSTVRPLQDLAFTLFYVSAGLQGWWSQSYTVQKADLPLERSWLLHTVVLPACMISPLWWRFLQNLRQTYEAQERWPYLGNALKYFLAAEVAIFGLFDPQLVTHPLYLTAFVMATLYQIWWDVFMDWELFESCGGWTWRLRRERLYPATWLYWLILALNTCLRFGWTFTLMPRHYLTRGGVLQPSDFDTLLSPALAGAEIIRRTLWGWLRVEWEAVKTQQTARQEAQVYDNSLLLLQQHPLQPMAISGPDAEAHPVALWTNAATSGHYRFSPLVRMSEMGKVQIAGELALYATAFSCLGLLFAAYRQVM